MIDQKTAPYAALILRVTMGLMFLAHAYLKVFVFGMAGAGKFFASIGLPAWFLYPILALEIIGGLALIAGVLVRWIAIPLFIEMIATIVLVHGANGWLASAKGGGWEFPALWAAGLAALALLGDGAHALVPSSRLTGSK
ncbi:MAG: DoxX family protein [Hyphomicrobiales bacterium]|nr:DoxX family protein [Hyphomicrobiales bacterium]MCC2108844.1 DoxX family protein [Hyphomicrobiales bacterium]